MCEEVETKVKVLSDADKILEKSGVKSSFWDYISLLFGNLLLIPMGILSAAITTRILGTKGYGYLAIFNLVTTLGVMMTANWTAASLIRFGREEYDQHGKLNHTFWARSILLIPSLVVGILAIYFLKDSITNYMEMPSWTIWLVIGSILLMTIRTYLDHILQAIHRMKAYASIQIFFTCVSILGLVFIVLEFLPKTYLSVIIVGLTANVLAMIILWSLLIPTRVIFPIKTDRRMVQEVLSFSYPVIMGNLGAYVVNWIDVMVIKYYLSLSEVGGYQLAYNMFNLSIGLIGSTTILMTPILISFLASNREDLILRYSTRFIPQGVLLWATVIGIGLGVCPPVFQIVFGEGFNVSIPYFQYLAIGLAFNSLMIFYSGEITAYKLIKLGVMASVVRALINLVGDFVLVPRIGPLGAAIATTTGMIAATIMYLLICQRQLKENLLWQLILVSPAFISLGVSRALSGPGTPFWATILTLTSAYFLARALHLFKSEDLTFLDYVQMPASLRKVVLWAYPLLSREVNLKGKEAALGTKR
jgi:O-antigen/teichoic acid export membrane protein